MFGYYFLDLADGIQWTLSVPIVFQQMLFNGILGPHFTRTSRWNSQPLYPLFFIILIGFSMACLRIVYDIYTFHYPTEALYVAVVEQFTDSKCCGLQRRILESCNIHIIPVDPKLPVKTFRHQTVAQSSPQYWLGLTSEGKRMLNVTKWIHVEAEGHISRAGGQGQR